MRRYVLWIITFAGGLFFLLEFCLPERVGGLANPLTRVRGDVTTFLVVVSTMAFLLGPLNLVRAHLATLLRGRKGWLESLTFVIALIVSVLAMTLKGSDVRNAMNVLYDGLVEGVMSAFFASSMALLAFYLVSAAHRAFRLSTLESGLMLAAAAVILLGQVPVGDLLTGGLPKAFQLSTWAQWILSVPNTGVQRGVAIGACGGAFAAGMRHWLGLGKAAR